MERKAKMDELDVLRGQGIGGHDVFMTRPLDHHEGPWSPARKVGTSDEAQQWISRKIRKLINEGKERDQASAIAYSMARDKGYDVPEKKSSVWAKAAATQGVMGFLSSIDRTLINKYIGTLAFNNWDEFASYASGLGAVSERFYSVVDRAVNANMTDKAAFMLMLDNEFAAVLPQQITVGGRAFGLGTLVPWINSIIRTANGVATLVSVLGTLATGPTGRACIQIYMYLADNLPNDSFEVLKRVWDVMAQRLRKWRITDKARGAVGLGVQPGTSTQQPVATQTPQTPQAIPTTAGRKTAQYGAAIGYALSAVISWVASHPEIIAVLIQTLPSILGAGEFAPPPPGPRPGPKSPAWKSKRASQQNPLEALAAAFRRANVPAGQQLINLIASMVPVEGVDVFMTELYKWVQQHPPVMQDLTKQSVLDSTFENPQMDDWTQGGAGRHASSDGSSKQAVMAELIEGVNQVRNDQQVWDQFFAKHAERVWAAVQRERQGDVQDLERQFKQAGTSVQKVMMEHGITGLFEKSASTVWGVSLRETAEDLFKEEVGRTILGALPPLGDGGDDGTPNLPGVQPGDIPQPPNLPGTGTPPAPLPPGGNTPGQGLPLPGLPGSSGQPAPQTTDHGMVTSRRTQQASRKHAGSIGRAVGRTVGQVAGIPLPVVGPMIGGAVGGAIGDFATGDDKPKGGQGPGDIAETAVNVARPIAQGAAGRVGQAWDDFVGRKGDPELVSSGESGAFDVGRGIGEVAERVRPYTDDVGHLVNTVEQGYRSVPYVHGQQAGDVAGQAAGSAIADDARRLNFYTGGHGQGCSTGKMVSSAVRQAYRRGDAMDPVGMPRKILDRARLDLEALDDRGASSLENDEELAILNEDHESAGPDVVKPRRRAKTSGRIGGIAGAAAGGAAGFLGALGPIGAIPGAIGGYMVGDRATGRDKPEGGQGRGGDQESADELFSFIDNTEYLYDEKMRLFNKSVQQRRGRFMAGGISRLVADAAQDYRGQFGRTHGFSLSEGTRRMVVRDIEREFNEWKSSEYTPQGGVPGADQGRYRFEVRDQDNLMYSGTEADPDKAKGLAEEFRGRHGGSAFVTDTQTDDILHERHSDEEPGAGGTKTSARPFPVKLAKHLLRKDVDEINRFITKKVAEPRLNPEDRDTLKRLRQGGGPWTMQDRHEHTVIERTMLRDHDFDLWNKTKGNPESIVGLARQVLAPDDAQKIEMFVQTKMGQGLTTASLVKQAVQRDISALQHDRAQNARPRLLASKSDLINKAANVLAKGITDVGRGMVFRDLCLASIMPSAVGSTGLMIEGEMLWNVKAASPRHKRARRLTLVMPVIAGEPQAISVFKTAAGQDIAFKTPELERYMRIRQTVVTGKRPPGIMIAYAG